jgi:hypothetical protein
MSIFYAFFVGLFVAHVKDEFCVSICVGIAPRSRCVLVVNGKHWNGMGKVLENVLRAQDFSKNRQIGFK